jgi:hypothetical protein
MRKCVTESWFSLDRRGVVWNRFWLVWVASPPESGGGLGDRRPTRGTLRRPKPTLFYATVLPGRKSGFRAGFRPHSLWESLKIGPPAGERPAGGPILGLPRLTSCRNPTRKPDFRPGSIVAYPKVGFWWLGEGVVWSRRPTGGLSVGPNLPYFTQQCFRVGNRASWSDFGRILVGKALTSADFEVFLIRVRPKSGPGDRFPARKHYRVT